MFKMNPQNPSLDLSKIISTVSLSIFIIFYLFFALFDGVTIAVDSPSYIDMSFTREPFYPLFLAFFRLFGDHYLLSVVIVQSLLMALAGWALADYLRKYFRIHPVYSSLLYLFPLATSLLCRFAAKRRSMYTNSILTEGLVTSLYLLFILLLFRYLLEQKRQLLIWLCVLAFLMISTRKQMLMLLPLLIFSLPLLPFIHQSSAEEYPTLIHSSRYLSLKRSLKILFQTILISIVILLSSHLFDCTYNYLVRGTFTRHSSDNRFITTMLFYHANRLDVHYLEDPQIQQLFLTIYDRCEENGYLGSQAGEGWLNEVSHFGDHYDHIQIDTMWPIILAQAGKNVGEDNIAEKDLETDRINRVIIQSLLPHKLKEMSHSLINNFASGLVTTIAQRTPLLIAYSIFAYAGFFLLLLYLCILHRKKIKENLLPVLLFSYLTLAGIVLNVGVVSAVIFCQTRYTIYNMPLFYLSGALLLYFSFLSLRSQVRISNQKTD